MKTVGREKRMVAELGVGGGCWCLGGKVGDKW
jgi:hypothetical protein